MLVSLLMAELGVHSVAYAFPMVKIITTAVDKSLDDFLHVVPGIGRSSCELSFRGEKQPQWIILLFVTVVGPLQLSKEGIT